MKEINTMRNELVKRNTSKNAIAYGKDDMTFSEDQLWKETTIYCKYCGIKMSQDTKYCTEECRKKDSVWNWSDD